jgi:predicted hydrocarbon binding protein
MTAANPSAPGMGLESRCYPNKLGRLALLSLEHVVGRAGVAALLHHAGADHLIDRYPPDDDQRAFPFHDLSRLMAAAEAVYGRPAARGLLLRAGRHAFRLGLTEVGTQLGAGDLALKLMPLTVKIKLALKLTARAFTGYGGQPTRVEERPGRLLYVIEACPVCWGRTSAEPSCFVAEGILDEALRWVSGGRSFRIDEIECAGAGGSACVWTIDTEPIDG